MTHYYVNIINIYIVHIITLCSNRVTDNYWYYYYKKHYDVLVTENTMTHYYYTLVSTIIY